MTEFPQHANCEAGNQTQKGLSGQKSLQSSNLLRSSFFSPALPSLSNPLRTIKDSRIAVVWKPRANLSVFTYAESAERRNRKGMCLCHSTSQERLGFFNGENRVGIPQQLVLSCCWLILPLCCFAEAWFGTSIMGMGLGAANVGRKITKFEDIPL